VVRSDDFQFSRVTVQREKWDILYGLPCTHDQVNNTYYYYYYYTARCSDIALNFIAYILLLNSRACGYHRSRYNDDDNQKQTKLCKNCFFFTHYIILSHCVQIVHNECNVMYLPTNYC